jgi:hypothetical protein
LITQAYRACSTLRRMMRPMRRLVGSCVAVSAVWCAGCARPAQEAYAPGLGELMSFQQMRHAKLWFAAQAANWDLAAYELDELSEGFDDVVKFHPTHKDSPVAPKDAIPRMIVEPIKELQDTVAKKDARRFDEAYATLTTACNNCHRAMNFGFNVVQTPTANPYSNQVFAVVR